MSNYSGKCFRLTGSRSNSRCQVERCMVSDVDVWLQLLSRSKFSISVKNQSSDERKNGVFKMWN